MSVVSVCRASVAAGYCRVIKMTPLCVARWGRPCRGEGCFSTWPGFSNFRMSLNFVAIVGFGPENSREGNRNCLFNGVVSAQFRWLGVWVVVVFSCEKIMCFCCEFFGTNMFHMLMAKRRKCWRITIEVLFEIYLRNAVRLNNDTAVCICLKSLVWIL